MSDPLRGERLTTVFKREVATPRLARRGGDPVFASWGLSGTMPDAVVVVSELMTNAIVHGQGDVALSLIRLPNRIRIEVRDEGPGVVIDHAAGADAVGGRGVHIVAQMARAWGVEPDVGGGKTVWAELDL